MEDYIYPFLARYMNSPEWVKRVVGGTYAKLSVRLRGGRRYGAFLEEAAQRELGALSSLTQSKLEATLKCAIASVPAYREYKHLLKDLDHPVDVLRQLPLITKEDIKAGLERFLSDMTPSRYRLKTATGGSTSTPMIFYLNKGLTRIREYAYMEDFHRRTGLGQDDIILAIRGRTVPTAALPGGKLWMYEPIKKHLILSSDHIERRHMPQHLEVVRQWKPKFIQAYPSTIYPFARWLKENPAPDVVQRIEGVMLYSENVLDHHMELLREVFQCPVIKHYGHSERVLMAASLPDDDRFFFWPQYGHFELVDDDGNVITKSGVLGEIVGTSFDNFVMPFVRYRTGDMAVLSDKLHPGLPGFPIVERIEGRRQEYIVCKDNRLIPVCGMGAAHSADLAVVDSMQFEQRRPGHLLIKVVVPRPLSDEARRRIVERMEMKTQGGCTAELIEVDSIPRTKRGKHQLIVQHLDIGQSLCAPVTA